MSSAYELVHKIQSTESVVRADHPLVAQRITRGLDRVIWWTGLALIPLVAIPYGSDKPWWIAGFEICVFVLGGLWIVKGLIAGAWPMMGAQLLAPVLTLGAYAILQTLPLIQQAAGPGATGWRPISADISGTYDFAFELLALIILAKIWLDCTRERSRLTWLIYVVIGVAAASATFGIIRVILQRTSPELMIFGLVREGFAQFVNRNYFSLLLEMALGLVLGFVLGGGVRRPRLMFHVGLILLLASTIVLTSSRGGVYTMISQVVFLVTCFTISRLYRSRLRLKEMGRSSWGFFGRLVASLVLISGLVLVMIIGVGQLGGERLGSRMDELPEELNSMEKNAGTQRIDVWRATGSMIRANLLAGVGFGAYRTAIPTYHEASGRALPSRAINSYLDLVAGGGIIGAAIVAWCGVVLIVNIGRGLKSKDSLKRAATFGAVGGIFGVGAHSLVDSGLVVPANAVILFALLVIASANPVAKKSTHRLASTAVTD